MRGAECVVAAIEEAQRQGAPGAYVLGSLFSEVLDPPLPANFEEHEKVAMSVVSNAIIKSTASGDWESVAEVVFIGSAVLLRWHDYLEREGKLA
jgi:hypothetical protein